MTKIMLIAGEPSGDALGGKVVGALKKLDPAAECFGIGGVKMADAGCDILFDANLIAVMGFVEVVKHFPIIKRAWHIALTALTLRKPDVLILIDYPGFNLPMARWAKTNGYKVVWYISPQVWAWKEKRVKALKKYVDRMLCILPFEKAFYKKWNFEVDYVGHPLIDEIKKELSKEIKLEIKSPLQYSGIIALLPGSRKQEITKKLPIMLQVAASMPAYQFVVAKAPGIDDSFYNLFLKNYSNVTSVRDKTYDLLKVSVAAIVTSGTATLETALFKVPQVVCYKGNPISYFIAKKIINIKYISLVNLILDKPVIKELIQHDMNVVNIKMELENILNNASTRDRIKKDYEQLWDVLSNEENASAKAAKIIVHIASSSSSQ